MSPEASTQLQPGDEVISNIGLYASLAAFVASVGYVVTQVLQVAGLMSFPSDAYWIYGTSLGIAAPYVVAIIAMHYSVPGNKKVWSHIAIEFGAMYAIYVSLNYTVQLGTVLPAARQGPLGDLTLLDQTPHSLFWDVDALGYICMGISTFFLGFATAGHRSLQIFLFANAAMVPVISFVYFFRHFSTAILLIGLPWMVTAPGSLLLLSLYFKRKKI